MRKMTLRAAVAGVCATVLIGAPALVSTAQAMPAERTAALQTVTITLKGVNITGIKAPANLRAGRVKLAVNGKSDGMVSIAIFDKGYDFGAFMKDLGASFGGDMKALKRAIAKSDFVGGLAPGHTGTIVLPKAGTYWAFSVGEKPGKVKSFKAGAVKRAPAPDTDAKIVAKTGARWGGSSHLPAKGTLLFKNAATDVPHFLEMMQVKEGTTKEQVMESFMAPPPEDGPPPPPEWMVMGGGHLMADALSMGRSMTVNYKLPKGQYVLLCFFPDPSMGGMPHAMMGMIRMVHVG